MLEIKLSALQHYAFCPRQCALIYMEQAWAENFLTAQGRVLHERVDSGEPETRKGIRYERSVHLSSQKFGLTGVADMVECELTTGRLTPVEYKRGKPKPTPIDKVQLCAQALCLEEMTGQIITQGVLWYGQTRHRQVVDFSDDLRQKTYQIIEKVRALLESGTTPAPSYGKQCKACSLLELCEPKLFGKDRSAQYVAKLFLEDEADDKLMDDRD